jgi:hypothetical protein
LKINILGCGPAGIFAAHAAVEAGHDVTILSIPRKSHMRGAQYLHRPIPGLSPDEDAPFQIEYALRGTIDGYREKVYGDRDVDVSVDSLVGKHDAWDIRKAYDAGFDRYQHLIRDFTFSTDPDVPQMELPEADLTFSTIPAKLLCQDDACAWESEWIWSTDSVRGAHRSMYFNEDFDGTFQDNKVLCSGDPDDFWYRSRSSTAGRTPSGLSTRSRASRRPPAGSGGLRSPSPPTATARPTSVAWGATAPGGRACSPTAPTTTQRPS